MLAGVCETSDGGYVLRRICNKATTILNDWLMTRHCEGVLYLQIVTYQSRCIIKYIMVFFFNYDINFLPKLYKAIALCVTETSLRIPLFLFCFFISDL